MKAILRKAFGDPDQLVVENVPDPKPEASEVIVRVKAFGINRAEIYMRRGLWGEAAAISGIECVGEIENDPLGNLKTGQRVAAIMGGMGRTRNGSYAELVAVPAANVFALESDLDWVELAAIPESYATAWSCLYENMHLESGNTIVIRGGTSALGQAAINIAANVEGVTVIATTRNVKNAKLLKRLGCTEVLVENADLSGKLREQHSNGVDSVMDIVGNTTLLDSLKMVKKDGYVCNAGFLGGGEPFQFNPLTDMPPTVNLNFFASLMFGLRDFPLSNIPMQQIVEKSSAGIYKNKPAKVFGLEQIALAHDMMEKNQAYGKIVVRI
jgi:NADPH:quinone reductase-like Zn-dependent oxidoreductase